MCCLSLWPRASASHGDKSSGSRTAVVHLMFSGSSKPPVGPEHQADAGPGPFFTLLPQPGLTTTHPLTLSSEALSSARSPGSTRAGRSTCAAPGTGPHSPLSLDLPPGTEMIHLGDRMDLVTLGLVQSLECGGHSTKGWTGRELESQGSSRSLSAQDGLNLCFPVMSLDRHLHIQKNITLF